MPADGRVATNSDRQNHYRKLVGNVCEHQHGLGSGVISLYKHVILPRLCDFALRHKRLRPYRERLIGAAEGRVLEVGIGLGLNLPFYPGRA